MNQTPAILIECSKMKRPNTGLYSFCYNLVNAIHKELKDQYSIGIFAPEVTFNQFPEDIHKLKVRWWNKFYMKLPAHTKIWHETFQLGKHHPSGDIKRVLTIHDLNFLYERNKIGMKAGLKVLQNNIDQADKLVAISEYTKRDILQYMDTCGKEIEVIHNGCEIYSGPITPPTNMPQKPFLFSLGTILAKKNFHVLPCLLENNDYDLIIAGNHSPYELKILKEAKRWNVHNRVHVIGAVSEPVKHWYLKNCSAFLFPSIAEGFGLPVVEAMYYGNPVFLSSHTSLPEIGGKAAYYFNNEFIPEIMQKDFSEGMQNFNIESGSVRLKERALGFSWQKAAEAYIKIYQSLL